jgi:hypothetical protein
LTFVRELTTRYLEVSPAYRKFQAAVGDREDRRLISGLTARLQQAGAGPDDLIDLREVADDITRLQDLACAETPDPRGTPGHKRKRRSRHALQRPVSGRGE